MSFLNPLSYDDPNILSQRKMKNIENCQIRRAIISREFWRFKLIVIWFERREEKRWQNKIIKFRNLNSGIFYLNFVVRLIDVLFNSRRYMKKWRISNNR